MMFLKTAAVALAMAGLSIVPGYAAEARLLEQTGDTGVHQVAGTLEWRETLDESGAPGLSAIVTLPEASLAVEVTLVKNNDPTLPASHLFQATFAPGEGFAGKEVVQLAGVMMRKGEDLKGTALPGASAKVLANQFLFAPAGPAPTGETLGTSSWIDLALVFETGQRALLALQVDDLARATLAQMAL